MKKEYTHPAVNYAVWSSNQTSDDEEQIKAEREEAMKELERVGVLKELRDAGIIKCSKLA